MKQGVREASRVESATGGRYATALGNVVGLLHLGLGLGKLAGWSAVHRGTWAVAFLSSEQAAFVAVLGIAANIVLGVAFLRGQKVLAATVATVGMSTLGVLCHGYVIAAGQLVAIGCGARTAVPVSSNYHHVMVGMAVVLLSMSCVLLAACSHRVPSSQQ